MITLYGIENCDTVKKARRWLEQHNVDYSFHDFRKQGLDATQLEGWLEELGWESVVNRRSTTWKQLDTSTRESMNAQSAAAIILQQPTLVKRPLLDTGSSLHVGFSAEQYRELFHQHTL